MAELATDPDPMAQVFGNFVTAWAEATEKVLAAEASDPVVALRATLRSVEGRYGRANSTVLGMVLLVLVTHWELVGDPDDFYEALSPIEQRLFEDCAAVKVRELADVASSDVAGDVAGDDDLSAAVRARGLSDDGVTPGGSGDR